jgi:hypothetical protein
MEPWKELLDYEFPGREIEFSTGNIVKEYVISRNELIDFISTEIIEKLIADIRDDLEWQDMQGKRHQFDKQQLRNKWLS